MGFDPDPGQPVFLLLRVVCIGKAFILSGFATSIGETPKSVLTYSIVVRS